MFSSKGSSRQVSGRIRTQRIGIGGVPAGVCDVVVELVVGVPAQHHVAEAEAALQRREELGLRHVLAAQDAVDVEDADLDMGQAALLDDLAGVGGGADVLRFQRHDVLPMDCRPPESGQCALAARGPVKPRQARKRKGRRSAPSRLDGLAVFSRFADRLFLGRDLGLPLGDGVADRRAREASARATPNQRIAMMTIRTDGVDDQRCSFGGWTPMKNSSKPPRTAMTAKGLDRPPRLNGPFFVQVLPSASMPAPIGMA